MQNEITQGNKIIAEFMGWDYSDNYVNGYNLGSLPPYHSSWDWLMPVVEKIEGLGYWVEIGRNMVEIYKPFENDDNFTSGETKIDAVWKTVIEFIKSYQLEATNS